MNLKLAKCCPAYSGPLLGWCPTHKWVPYQASINDGEMKIPGNPSKAVRTHDVGCPWLPDHLGACVPGCAYVVGHTVDAAGEPDDEIICAKPAVVRIEGVPCCVSCFRASDEDLRVSAL